MNRSDKEGKQMLLTVFSVYSNPSNNFATIRPGFVIPMGLVKDEINKINQAETFAGEPITGDTLDKEKKFELMMNAVFHVASAASAYFSAPASNELASKVRVSFSLSHMLNLPYNEAETFTQGIIDTVTPVIDDLSPYGVTQPDLDEAILRRKNFIDIQKKPQINIDERKTQNANIHPFVKAGKSILTEMCDPIANTLFTSHHDLYQLWFNARQIIDFPHGTTVVQGFVFKADGQTPIFNAKVFFPEQNITTYTLIDGSYRVIKFPIGVTSPVASYDGKEQKAQPFLVKQGQTSVQNFKLEI